MTARLPGPVPAAGLPMCLTAVMDLETGAAALEGIALSNSRLTKRSRSAGRL